MKNLKSDSVIFRNRILKRQLLKQKEEAVVEMRAAMSVIVKVTTLN